MEGGLGEKWGSKCAVIIICTSEGPASLAMATLYRLPLHV